jgi:hypothetical protein
VGHGGLDSNFEEPMATPFHTPMKVKVKRLLEIVKEKETGEEGKENLFYSFHLNCDH